MSFLEFPMFDSVQVSDLTALLVWGIVGIAAVVWLAKLLDGILNG